MSVASQILLLVERVSEEIKGLTNKLSVGIQLRSWTSNSVFRKGQYTTYSGKLYILNDIDGSTGAANEPPGPYRGSSGGGLIISSGGSVAAGTIDADAIHGACFTIAPADTQEITHIGVSVVSNQNLVTDTIFNVWVGLASDPPPDEGTTPHGTVLIPYGTVSTSFVKLSTPWTPPVDTPLTVWFGPTGSAFVNTIRTATSVAIEDRATASTVGYVTRPRGGVKTDQVGKFISINFRIAGTDAGTVWGEVLDPPAVTGTLVGADLYSVTMDGTSVLFDPSLYRRSDFTTGVTPTTVTLQNPTPPAVGKCIPAVTLLIRTPAATTPGIITWVNLTGGSFIPLPAASQVVAAQLEWVDEIIGWLVVGVRA